MSTGERHNNRSKKQMNGRMSVASDVTQKLDQFDPRIINYLVEKGIPGWFRGTSAFQMDAADELLNAIRDDTEQRTAHRVRAVLMQIGIEPLITVAETKLLVRLSRGNDLAFLWFLMELHYKTPSSNFSVNEQLIMSTMAHLDMITTMRELDRILPPSSMSKREWLKRQKAKQQHQKSKPKSKAPKPQYVLPYFEKQVRSHSFSKPLAVPEPDIKVSFGVYDNYKDPTYIVHNESNRWYANYQLNPGKRIVNSIIHEEIGRMFDDFETAPSNTEHGTMLCGRHKAIQELEKSLEDQLRVIARERCMQYFDVNKRGQAEREARIRDMLEKDIHRNLCEFRKLAAKTEQRMVVMTVENECDYQYHLVDINGEPCKENCSQEQNKTDTEFAYRAEGARKSNTLPTGSHVGWDNGNKECQHVKEKGKDKESTFTCRVCGNGAMRNYFDDILFSDIHEEIGENRASKDRVSNIDNLVHVAPETCDAICDHFSAQDTNRQKLTTTPLETYFAAPADHTPYLFNYPQIFTFKGKDDNKFNVHHTLIQAMDSEVNLPKNVSDSKLDLDDAVRNCATKIWKREVAKKNVETDLKEERKRKAAIDNDHLLLYYDMEYYDPEDHDLMNKLLMAALENMRKNTKFVLATFPDAYKLPTLREWILQRYGKLYTKADCYKSFLMSTKIYNALEKMIFDIKIPSARDLGKNPTVNYSCRDYLLKKSKYIKEQYFKRLDRTIMEQSRVFWFAMRAYLSSNGPLRNTFFYAYMPARTKDILHFALWKPTEFMDYKAVWDRRMFMKDIDDQF